MTYFHADKYTYSLNCTKYFRCKPKESKLNLGFWRLRNEIKNSTQEAPHVLPTQRNPNSGRGISVSKELAYFHPCYWKETPKTNRDWKNMSDLTLLQ